MALHRVRLTFLFLAALSTALIAGFFYAYACSVMIGLAQLDAAAFIRAMQSVNATVRNGVFAFSFFGAVLFSGIAALLYLPRRTRTTWLLLCAFLVYALGGFGVTFLFNVPLNESLAQARDLTAVNTDAIRRAYEEPWVRWNGVRTIASTIAFLLLAAALFTAGRDTEAARMNTAPHDTGTTRTVAPGREFVRS